MDSLFQDGGGKSSSKKGADSLPLGRGRIVFLQEGGGQSRQCPYDKPQEKGEPAEAESNRGPSAYRLYNALPLGQTGSLAADPLFISVFRMSG